VSNLDDLHYFRKKFNRNCTDYGLWISWKKSISFLFQPLYQKIIYYLYELDLNKEIDDNTTTACVFRLVAPDDRYLIDQIEEMEEWLKGSFRKKLQDNCLCMVVMDGERVIGFNYASIGQGDIPLLKLRILIGPTEAWSEQITISNAYRRQGLGSLLRRRFYHELRSNGITKLYGHRQEFNFASEQSSRKFTRDILVRAEYRRILGFHRLKLTKPAPVTLNSGQHRLARVPILIRKTFIKNVFQIPNHPIFTTRSEDLT
jgi:ribosomal protein S18 acetylase RimI-like enzyme